MRKIVAGLAITLDGVVDSPSGNWMQFDGEMSAVIDAGVAQADAILLGRNTYLTFAEMWPKLGSNVPMADFMNNTHKYIVSSTLTSLDWANSSLLTGDLAAELSALKQQPGKNIQIPGSPRLVWSLLRDGLLDELSLMIHPIVIGAGTRLFEKLTDPLKVELVEARSLRSGVITATYRPVPDAKL
jgi:dihydrofolate reductase